MVVVIFLLFSLTFTLFCPSRGEIGDLTVKKTDQLVLNKWQQTQCDKLLPLTTTCDTAYDTVDDFCRNYAAKIVQSCDQSYSKLKNSCNNSEKKITDACKKTNGYVTAKCGQQFDRLKRFCRVGSETISRSCVGQYKKKDEICGRKYGKIDLKCNHVYEQYEDLCEGLLEENVRFDEELEEEIKLDDNEDELNEIKKMTTPDFKEISDSKMVSKPKSYSDSMDLMLSEEKRIAPSVEQPAQAKMKPAVKALVKPEPVGKSLFDYFEKERKAIKRSAFDHEEY